MFTSITTGVMLPGWPLASFSQKKNKTTLNSEQNLNSLEESSRSTSITNCFHKAVLWTRRYSDLWLQGGLLALDVAFLAEKLDSDTPEELVQATLATLSLIGILGIPFAVDYLRKLAKDTCFAKKNDSYALMVLSACKTTQLSATVLLTMGNFMAAVAGLVGQPTVQMELYSLMRWPGTVGIMAGTVLTLISIPIDRKTMKQLEGGIASELMEGVRQQLIGMGDAEASREQKQLASQIRFSMDKDTLAKLLQTLEEVPSEELQEKYQVIADNLKTQLYVNLGGKIFLILLGDALMVVERIATPNSLTSACINTGVAGLYTARLALEKLLECRQRDRIDISGEGEETVKASSDPNIKNEERIEIV